MAGAEVLLGIDAARPAVADAVEATVGALRSRYIAVDLGTWYRQVVPVAGVAQGDVRVELFDDVTVVARPLQVEHQPPLEAGWAPLRWSGNLMRGGVEAGAVTFSVDLSTVDDAVRVHGLIVDHQLQRAYELRWLEGNVHGLYEVPAAEGADEGASGPVTATSSGDPLPDLGAEPHGPSAAAAAATPIVDVLVAYTAATRHAYPGIVSDIQSRFNQMNTAYARSGIDARMRLVRTHEIGYTQTSSIEVDFFNLRDRTSGLDVLQTERETYGADLVMLIVPNATDYCGIASMNPAGHDGWAWNIGVTARACFGGMTLEHELGHNMGGDHDRANASENSAVRYNYGYRVPGRFATVMAYTTGCTPACPRTANFSNPNVSINGFASGTAVDNNARMLNENAPRIADNRAASLPIGHQEWLRRVPGGASVGGWALDPDFPGAIQVHHHVRNATTGTVTAIVVANADQYRPDIAHSFPAHGPYHGFETTISLGVGTWDVLTYGIGVGANGVANGSNALVGSGRVVVVGDPYGHNESIRQYPNNAVGVRGWAIDPDTAASINVHFYRGPLSSGIWLGSTTANVSRPDVGAAYPGYGNNHGFSAVLPFPQTGTHDVCAYAINHTGPGANQLIGCRTQAMANTPFGHFESATRTANLVNVVGWAIDPDTDQPIQIDLYQGLYPTAPGIGRITANVSRPDVGAAYPGYGNNHGFNTTITINPLGENLVCAYAINHTGPGDNPLLQCRTIPLA